MTSSDRSGPRPGFIESVAAEQLPTRLTWHLPDTIALLAVPAIFLGGWISSRITDDITVRTICDTIVRIAIFVAVVILNRQLLGRHWRAFWSRPWKSMGLVIAGLVAIQVVISVLSALLRPLAHEATHGAQQTLPETTGLGVLILVSLAPMVTALIEDFTFRHTLLLKFPVWGHWWSAAALVVTNALLFGAVHINNFGGEWLLTLTYAGAGLLMNLTYLWTRNIWHVLLMHGLNNFILAGPVTVILVYVLQVAVG